MAKCFKLSARGKSRGSSLHVYFHLKSKGRLKVNQVKGLNEKALEKS